MAKHVAVIGGGITGLTAAFYLQKLAASSHLDLHVTVIETKDQFGGKVETVHRDGFTIERGPDSFLKRKKEALELVEALGLGDQVVSNHTGKSYILKSGELHPIPEGSVMGVPTQLKPMLDSGLLSEDGKARALNDLILPQLPEYEDMSVGDFFSARLGEEMVDHIISPLLSGIYAGNIYKLSLAATQPQFINVERDAGSLILGFNGKQPKKKTSQFATLTSGLGTLIERLVDSLDARLLRGVTVSRIKRENHKYELILNNNEKITADMVVSAVPNDISANLFSDAAYLKRENADPNTSVATVAMAFDKDDVTLEKEGTGFVVSRKEPIAITASTWTHLKWPHTVPEGKALVRCYVGKAGDDAIIEQSDEELIATSLQNLSGVVDFKKDPHFSVVTRWREAMPQYPVGHKLWLAEIQDKLPHDYPGVYLAGASYDGVGLPDCIRQGKGAAQKIIERIKTGT
ncbi:oxygen-dependent protoporphyrinogen oxidase [Scopulibacillus darangshiensis]|uniref:Coproporphyrinogen III oxidase n=1 Tax=Scopulibacillus darangshiensis TaxID=442528 RepID=A0A4R2P5L9_9BACL|nr:protoporphyrinogen oxidase [Scopulibacillus darangshiensis]TCP29261.1 oxygen-dependent protoporphyrinogen oxidase [Scopulibacillus darangshiensis]